MAVFTVHRAPLQPHFGPLERPAAPHRLRNDPPTIVKRLGGGQIWSARTHLLRSNLIISITFRRHLLCFGPARSQPVSEVAWLGPNRTHVFGEDRVARKCHLESEGLSQSRYWTSQQRIPCVGGGADPVRGPERERGARSGVAATARPFGSRFLPVSITHATLVEWTASVALALSLAEPSGQRFLALNVTRDLTKCRHRPNMAYKIVSSCSVVTVMRC